MKRLVFGSFESNIEEDKGRNIDDQRKKNPKDETAAGIMAGDKITPHVKNTQHARSARDLLGCCIKFLIFGRVEIDKLRIIVDHSISPL